MKRPILAGLLAATALAAAVLPAPPSVAGPAPHGGAADLQRDADAIRETGVTGVLARAATGHQVRTVTSGVADVRTARKLRADGYFRIGSTNKLLVATVVLQLVEAGKLGLDDTVEKWLPGFVRGNGNDGRKITVRQLLQHTAGIYDGNFPLFTSAKVYYERRFRPRDEVETVKAGISHAPDFEPGTGWSYSNTGYNLVGMVIKAVTGRTWHDEVDRLIVQPLDLRHTYFPGQDPRISRPHANGYRKFEEHGPYVDTTEVIDADASGGYISTLADLDRFQRALFDGRLLKPAQLAELTKEVPVPNSEQLWRKARYGLGLFSRELSCGGRVWIPGGDQIGYKTRLAVSADGKRSVVVSMSTQLHSAEAALQQDHAATALIDRVFCR